MRKNFIFYIFQMYEFLHSQGHFRPTHLHPVNPMSGAAPIASPALRCCEMTLFAITGLLLCSSQQHSADGDHVLQLRSMVKLFDLSRRIALVTGASRGLGYAMAEALAEAGATVILNGRDADTLKVAANRIRDRGFSAETIAFDVNDQPAADAAIKSIVDHHQRLDILIANAGVTHRAQLADWTSEAWDRVLSANLKACFFLAQQASAPMRSQKYGRIIFITSAVGILGRSTVHAYAASKSGLAGLARSLAAELGEYGITCNAIAPGWF